MGICKRTKDQKSVKGCKDPAGGAVKSCTPCWDKDYEKEISINPNGRYFEKYKKDGTRHSFNFNKKFKIYIPLKAGGDAVVDIRLKTILLTDVTEANENAAKTKLENGINTHWNGKFKLKIEDPDCGTKEFPINFKAIWVDTNEHYTMQIHKTYDREGLSGTILNVSENTSDWIYAHEFGHCFGLPDEYSYTPPPNDDETVKYYKPDGTLGEEIAAPYNGKKSTDASVTLMAALSNTTVLKRHGWFFAIEAKDLINKPGVTCDII